MVKFFPFEMLVKLVSIVCERRSVAVTHSTWTVLRLYVSKPVHSSPYSVTTRRRTDKHVHAEDKVSRTKDITDPYGVIVTIKLNIMVLKLYCNRYSIL